MSEEESDVSLKTRRRHCIAVRLEKINKILFDKDMSKFNDTQNVTFFDFLMMIKQKGGRNGREGSFEYVNSGSVGHTFKASYYIGDKLVEYAVKISAYLKDPEYADKNVCDKYLPENVEVEMLKIMSELVKNGVTVNITTPIHYFRTPIGDFVELIRNISEECDMVIDKFEKKIKDIDKNGDKNEVYELGKIIDTNKGIKKNVDMFLDQYKADQFHNHVSIVTTEWANGGDLLSYMQGRYDKFKLNHWKWFFFQVVSVFAVIQNFYPNFRHNDAKANNFLVTKGKFNCGRLVIEGNVFGFGAYDRLITLGDWDFACIPPLIKNYKVMATWSKKYNINERKNQYYDIHYFFNTLVRKRFLPEIMTSDKVPKEVKEFVNRVVPPKLRSGGVTKRGRLLTDKEYTTPLRILLEDPFFQSYRLGRIKEID